MTTLTAIPSRSNKVYPCAEFKPEMYLAEFTFPGTTELVNDLLLKTSSEGTAKDFALEYAANWGIELFALTPASEEQARSYHTLGKIVPLG